MCIEQECVDLADRSRWRRMAGRAASTYRRHWDSSPRHRQADAASGAPDAAAASPHHRVFDGDRSSTSATIARHVPAVIAPRQTRAAVQPMAAEDVRPTGSGGHGRRQSSSGYRNKKIVIVLGLLLTYRRISRINKRQNKYTTTMLGIL